MKNKVIAMMLILATIMTPVSMNSMSVNAFNDNYTNAINVVSKSELSFNKDKTEATIDVLSTDENNNDFIITREDLNKILQEATVKHLTIRDTYKIPTKTGFESDFVNSFTIPTESLKNKEPLRVYIEGTTNAKYQITDTYCNYDANDNLVVKLPKIAGQYYLTDAANKKEFDDKVFDLIKRNASSDSLFKGSSFDCKAGFNDCISKMTVKSSNKKNVSVKGTTVTMRKGKATITMKIVLKDGGTKTIKVKLVERKTNHRNNLWNNLPENKKGGCK